MGSCHGLGLQPPSVHRPCAVPPPGLCSLHSPGSGSGRPGQDGVKLADRLWASSDHLPLPQLCPVESISSSQPSLCFHPTLQMGKRRPGEVL